MDVYYNNKDAAAGTAGPTKEEPLLDVGSDPTEAGPRESIRLEAKNNESIEDRLLLLFSFISRRRPPALLGSCRAYRRIHQ